MLLGKAHQVVLGGLLLSVSVLPEGAHAQQIADADIQQLSIEQLANVEITSVSKTPQPLSTAAAAIYVISHDDVIRSGATSLPDILRLAPNLEVMQTSPSSYEITARGFNGNSADQNFPDKLLVLIDGRSVYSPLYSGVYWDVQDVLPEDIEHIEVISGPGGTLWGANAVNGVVNIITRKASDTQPISARYQLSRLHRLAAARHPRRAVRVRGRRARERVLRRYGQLGFDTRIRDIHGDAHVRLQPGVRAQHPGRRPVGADQERPRRPRHGVGGLWRLLRPARVSGAERRGAGPSRLLPHRQLLR